MIAAANLPEILLSLHKIACHANAHSTLLLVLSEFGSVCLGQREHILAAVFLYLYFIAA